MRSIHFRRKESLPAVFLSISRQVGDGSSNLSKAVLKKIALQRQLSDGFEHLVVRLLQVGLLPLGAFPLSV